MENIGTFTLLGHEISIAPSIDRLSGTKYDDVIERINQAILDGNDAGVFESYCVEYEWEICQPELNELYTIAIYAVLGGIKHIESFSSEESAHKYLIKWANENNTEGLAFDDIHKALEWFGNNEEELDYTIDFFKHSINK